MGQYDENLYETRTNLFSSENIVDYLWRRCEKSSKFFKPDNSFGINTKEVEKKQRPEGEPSPITLFLLNHFSYLVFHY